MKDFYKYDYNSDLNILFKYYYGPLSIENIFSSWEYAINKDVIPCDIKGFILDFRDSSFDFNIDRVSDISNFFKEHIKVFGGTKIGLITLSPDDIVIPILFTTKNTAFKSLTFSTKQAALDWILE